MNYKRNRFLRALGISAGPLLISISQYFQLSDMIYYPIIMTVITVFIFIFAYIKTPKFYIKEIDSGILIAGSKQGFYDPDFIEYKNIQKVECVSGKINMTLKDSGVVTIYLPKKYRNSFLAGIQDFL